MARRRVQWVERYATSFGNSKWSEIRGILRLGKIRREIPLCFQCILHHFARYWILIRWCFFVFCLKQKRHFTPLFKKNSFTCCCWTTFGSWFLSAALRISHILSPTAGGPVVSSGAKRNLQRPRFSRPWTVLIRHPTQHKWQQVRRWD